MTIEDYKQKDREKRRKEFTQLMVEDMYEWCFPPPPELLTGMDKPTLIEQRESEARLNANRL